MPTYAFGTLRFLDIGFPTGNTLQETYCRFLLCPKCYCRPRFRPRRAAGVCRASGSSSLRAFALLTASPLRLLASALAIVFIRHLEFHIYAGYSSSGLSCVSGLRQSSTLLSLVAPSARPGGVVAVCGGGVCCVWCTGAPQAWKCRTTFAPAVGAIYPILVRLSSTTRRLLSWGLLTTSISTMAASLPAGSIRRWSRLPLPAGNKGAAVMTHRDSSLPVTI